MLGGSVERRYRAMRPEVEALPWHTLNPGAFSPQTVLRARRIWTEAAFQEFRTGAACAATLQALIHAQAPVDLIAMASRFALDEMVHVELCARLAQLLGGGAPLEYDPNQLVRSPDAALRPLMQAAELVVCNFCVGEALSIPVLRAGWHGATHPLIKAVLGRIVKDEAAHGAFGFMFLDWADAQLSADDRRRLSDSANETVATLAARWAVIDREAAVTAPDTERLGWLESRGYVELARRALNAAVIKPLAAFSIHVTPV